MIVPKKIILLLVVIMLTYIWILVPPVWQLRSGPIQIAKGPKAQIQIGPGSQTWLPFHRTSKHTVYAFVTAEDGRFFEHHGIDFNAIWNSLKTNWKHQKIVRGGSTITQQVVKLAFLGQEKTLLRKTREVLGAIALERLISKEKILEWYFNLVPMGSGLIGIREAASHYFNEVPELLTIENSIQLAIILPRPSDRSEVLVHRKLTEFGHKRFYQIVQAMFDYGYLTETLKAHALATGDFGKPISITEHTDKTSQL